MVACVLNREGGTVLGGCCCRAFFQVVSVCLTLSPSRFIITLPVCANPPSRNRIALRIDRESLFFVGFARIGRAFLSMEGGMVGNGRLGWGFGGWNGWVVD